MWSSRKITLVIFQRLVLPFSTLIISISLAQTHFLGTFALAVTSTRNFPNDNRLQICHLKRKRTGTGQLCARCLLQIAAWDKRCHSLECRQPPVMQHGIRGLYAERSRLPSCHPVTHFHQSASEERENRLASPALAARCSLSAVQQTVAAPLLFPGWAGRLRHGTQLTTGLSLRHMSPKSCSQNIDWDLHSSFGTTTWCVRVKADGQKLCRQRRKTSEWRSFSLRQAQIQVHSQGLQALTDGSTAAQARSCEGYRCSRNPSAKHTLFLISSHCKNHAFLSLYLCRTSLCLHVKKKFCTKVTYVSVWSLVERWLKATVHLS